MDEKEPQLETKTIRITERDYRFFLALMFSLAFIIAALTKNETAMSVLGPIASMATGWYFASKRQ